MEQLKVGGKSVERKEGRLKVTGRASFCRDWLRLVLWREAICDTLKHRG